MRLFELLLAECEAGPTAELDVQRQRSVALQA